MQTKTLVISGTGIVAVAVAAAVMLRPIPDDIAADPTPPSAVSEQAAIAADPAVEPTVDPAPTVAADPIDPAPEAAPQAEVIAAPILPQVTDRRFEPDGAYLLFGTAQPDQTLAVMVDGTEVERLVVAPDGSFLATGFLGFSDAPRTLMLIGDPDGAALAGPRRFIFDANPAPVIVAAVDAPIADTVAETPTPTEQVAEAVDIPAMVEAPVEAEVEAPVQAEAVAQEDPADPATPAILAISGDGVEVVQPAVPADTPPEVMSTVALDTITYDPAGDVVLGGRALGQGFVQVYVNNAPVSRLPVDAQGRWRGDLPDVDTGVYTLRIDEVDAAGKVVSRIETPFLREDPEDVIAAMADAVDNPDFTIATRTVQAGTTLWAIAEERYGSGVMYVNVFEANKDRIRDPDLIYPGQVFTLPEDDS